MHIMNPSAYKIMHAVQALGSMIRYPNQMSFDVMENGGLQPPPQGVLLVEVVRLDKIVGGGRIFKVIWFFISVSFPADCIC